MTWETKNLGDLATFINGYPFKPSEWSKNGMEIIRIQNLTKGASESNYFEGIIPEKYKISKGDILISWSATLDIFVWEGDDAWLNQHIFKVVFDKIEIDKNFFIYLIKHILDDMKKEVHGATMKHITKGKFDNMQVPLPPLPIQKRIAAILDAADALRRKDQELLKKYDELAQAIFIDMFGDPVRNEKGWEVKKLGDVCTKITDGTHFSPPNQKEGGIPYITAKHLKKDFIDFYSNPTYISKENHESIYTRCTPVKGDVLYIKDGATTGISAVNEFEFEFSMLSSLALIKPKKAILNSYFLSCYLNNNVVKENLIRNFMAGAAIRRFTLEKINKFEILIPPIGKQNLFEIKWKNVQSNSNILKNVKSEHLFNCLLQKAFKGELTAYE